MAEFGDLTTNKKVIHAEDQFASYYNGGGNMDNGNNHEFVTHKEFNSAMHSIDKQFDHMDKRFGDLHLALYKDMVGLCLGAVSIIGVLIALFALLK